MKYEVVEEAGSPYEQVVFETDNEVAAMQFVCRYYSDEECHSFNVKVAFINDDGDRDYLPTVWRTLA